MGVHGLPPSEYWGMTPNEVWLFVDAKTPEQRRGNMSESSYQRLIERREELEAQGVKVM